MKTLPIQYITDISGHKNGVLLSLSDWEQILKELEELEILRDKQKFFLGLQEAFAEVKLIKQGKKKPNSFKDLIHELRNNSNS